MKISWQSWGLCLALSVINVITLFPKISSQQLHVDEIFWLCSEETWFFPLQNPQTMHRRLHGSAYFSNGPVAKYLYQAVRDIHAPGVVAQLPCERWPYVDLDLPNYSHNIQNMVYATRTFVTLLSAVVVLLAYILGTTLLGKAGGVIYAIFFISNPLFQDAAVAVLSEIPYLILFFSNLLLLIKWVQQGKNIRLQRFYALLAGILSAGIFMTKPFGALFFYCFVGVIFYFHVQEILNNRNFWQNTALLMVSFIGTLFFLYPGMFMSVALFSWWTQTLMDTAYYHAHLNPQIPLQDIFTSPLHKAEVLITDMLMPGTVVGISFLPLLGGVCFTLGMVSFFWKRKSTARESKLFALLCLIFIVWGYFLIPVRWSRYYLTLFIPMVLLMQTNGFIWFTKNLFDLRRKLRFFRKNP